MFAAARKTSVFLVKLLLIVGIFAFLFWQAADNNAFDELRTQPKRWELILAAFVVQCLGVSVTFIRWRWLAEALGLPMTYKDAFRLGFLGLTLNLAPMGIVGSDVIKAYMLAKKNPEERSKAVASVIVDRIVGLLVMFLLGSLLVLVTGFAFRDNVLARSVTVTVFTLTGVGYACVGIVFLPFFAKGHVERMLTKIPLCGEMLGRLTESLLLYRHRKGCLAKSFLITFLVHLPFGVALGLVAHGLFATVPGLVDHLLLYNVVNLTAMIPLAAGPFELVLNELYPLFVVDGEPMGKGIGMVVALGHRIVSLLVAAIGIVYYLSSRDEIREAEKETTPSPPAAP